MIVNMRVQDPKGQKEMSALMKQAAFHMASNNGELPYLKSNILVSENPKKNVKT